ncbi:MAG: hypothetical protein OdinLCB4_004435 [Candidatus Odinarchaeum yellowstonii]|jgi:RNA binding exosome subunit|uniref:Exosome protein n=1 Tax=Odinarchaeota yellowstonii (strain LCB_4) TaxID=1841599 RepID=A0AAF0D147_ODILC|nr:MAG: hypothetical protein OdinLCB4_004435 [Candidatus Odinarchaeum yellowstonii]
MPVLFQEIDFEVLCHATEDEDKVIQAVKNLIPVEFHSSIRINKAKLEGHYHNPIIKFNIILEGETQVRRTLLYIFKRLNREERRDLTEKFESYLDETGSFYLRVNKNMSYKGVVALKFDTGDIIRLKTKIRKEKPIPKTEIIKEYVALISETTT